MKPIDHAAYVTNLERLAGEHARVGAVANRNSVRLRCRRYCAERGLQVPAWAAPIAPGAKPVPLVATLAERLPEPLAVVPYASCRAWRAALPGERALIFFGGSAAITLVRHDMPGIRRAEARFETEAAALEALALGAVVWREPAPRATAKRRLAGMFRAA